MGPLITDKDDKHPSKGNIELNLTLVLLTPSVYSLYCIQFIVVHQQIYHYWHQSIACCNLTWIRVCHHLTLKNSVSLGLMTDISSSFEYTSILQSLLTVKYLLLPIFVSHIYINCILPISCVKDKQNIFQLFLVGYQ